MYSRDYDGQTLRFEPSGGLMQGSLVMQDKETDSYWSIMTGRAEAGAQEGTHLEELPVGVKVQWREWLRRHPHTVVLSVDGVEDLGRDAYSRYYESDEGYRQMTATDTRLRTKEPVYTVRVDGRAVAVPFSEFEGGAVFEVGGRVLFLYRPQGAALFHSTAAWTTSRGRFRKADGVWVHQPSGGRFDSSSESFPEHIDLERLGGFDTFWYNWSLIHPGSLILRREP